MAPRKTKAQQPDCTVTLDHDFEPVTGWYFKRDGETTQHRVSRCVNCGAEVLELRNAEQVD